MPFENATPRPWKHRTTLIYHSHEIKGAVVCACSEPRATDTLQYTEPKIDSPDLEEVYANAELIVTAVNAHEALVNALSRLEALTRILPPSMDEPGSALAEAREALALARGYQ